VSAADDLSGSAAMAAETSAADTAANDGRPSCYPVYKENKSQLYRTVIYMVKKLVAVDNVGKIRNIIIHLASTGNAVKFRMYPLVRI
jgi:hypothetical protein